MSTTKNPRHLIDSFFVGYFANPFAIHKTNFLQIKFYFPFWQLLVLSQCNTTSAFEGPRSSGNDCTNIRNHLN